MYPTLTLNNDAQEQTIIPQKTISLIQIKRHIRKRKLVSKYNPQVKWYYRCNGF